MHAVVARTPGRPDLMKPHPDAINRALDILGVAPEACCMIGDSVSDIIVCQATGVRSIGYAKNPRRGQELADVGADALVDSMTTLSRAVRSHPRSPETRLVNTCGRSKDSLPVEPDIEWLGQLRLEVRGRLTSAVRPVEC